MKETVAKVVSRTTSLKRKPKAPKGEVFSADVRPEDGVASAHDRQEAERDAERDVHDWRTRGRKF